jgi:GTPase SAR1 family protein
MFKIGLIGGPNTGKSSLLRRFCGHCFQAAYTPTTDAFGIGSFHCGGEILLSVIDFDGSFVLRTKGAGKDGYSAQNDMSKANGLNGLNGSFMGDGHLSGRSSSRYSDGNINSPYSPWQREDERNTNLCHELCSLDAIIFVIDVSDRESFRFLDSWLEFLDSLPMDNEEVDKYLFANKGDTPKDQWVISPENLSLFCTRNGIHDYAVTVSHPRLTDINYSRPAFAKQRAPEDVLREIVFRLISRKCAIVTSGCYYPKYEYHTDADLFGSPVLKYVSYTLVPLEHNASRDDNDADDT